MLNLFVPKKDTYGYRFFHLKSRHSKFQKLSAEHILELLKRREELLKKAIFEPENQKLKNQNPKHKVISQKNANSGNSDDGIEEPNFDIEGNEEIDQPKFEGFKKGHQKAKKSFGNRESGFEGNENKVGEFDNEQIESRRGNDFKSEISF